MTATYEFREIRVVCTDRGTHGSRELAKIGVEDDPEFLDGLRALEGGERWAGVYYWHTRFSVSEGRAAKRGGAVKAAPALRSDEEDARKNRWQFFCKTCGRDVQLRHPVLDRLLRGVLEAERRCVDISYLPARLS